MMRLNKGLQGLLKKEKFMEFLRQVWGELKKVVWPSRKDTIKYSVIVIAFSLGVAFYLGAVDYGLLKVFQTIVNK